MSDPIDIPFDILPNLNTNIQNLGIQRTLGKIDTHRKRIIHEVYARWFKTNYSNEISTGIYNNIAVDHDIVIYEYNGGGISYVAEKRGHIHKIEDPKFPDISYGIEHLRTGYNDILAKWEDFKKRSNSMFEKVLDLCNDIEEKLILELSTRMTFLVIFKNYKVSQMAFSGISKEQIMRKSFDKNEFTNTVKNC